MRRGAACEAFERTAPPERLRPPPRARVTRVARVKDFRGNGATMWSVTTIGAEEAELQHLEGRGARAATDDEQEAESPAGGPLGCSRGASPTQPRHDERPKTRAPTSQ